MSNFLLETNKNYPFDKIKLHTPQPIQGGSYLAKISLNDNPIIFQTPKCSTKRGVHKTEKKIYCDLLFKQEDIEYIEWLNDIESKVQQLIYDKKDLWFVENELSLEDIEYNWIDTVKNYKKHYLLRTFIPKIHKNVSIQVFDDEQNKLTLDDISVEDSLIGIIELHSLKFSSSSFHLEFSLRQCMIIKEKPIFNECLIKFGSSKPLENIKTIDHKEENVLETDINTTYNEEENENDDYIDTDDKTEVEELSIIKQDNIEDKQKNTELVEMDKENQIEENNLESDKVQQEQDNIIDNKEEENDSSDNQELEKKEIINEVIDGINEKTLEKTNNDNDTLEKSDKNELNQLDEFTLNVPENSESINLKNANEIYLDIYNEARKKAKEAKLEAVQQYLMAKRIKQTYLLNEIDLSDSDDEDFLLFSEK